MVLSFAVFEEYHQLDHSPVLWTPVESRGFHSKAAKYVGLLVLELEGWAVVGATQSAFLVPPRLT